MDCDFCMEPFDIKGRRPKSLPCGHIFCLRCLQMIKAEASDSFIRCPEDMEAVAVERASDLPDSFYLLSRIREGQRSWNDFESRPWCAPDGDNLQPHEQHQPQGHQDVLDALLELQEECNAQLQDIGIDPASLHQDLLKLLGPKTLSASLCIAGPGVLLRARELPLREHPVLRLAAVILLKDGVLQQQQQLHQCQQQQHIMEQQHHLQYQQQNQLMEQQQHYQCQQQHTVRKISVETTIKVQQNDQLMRECKQDEQIKQEAPKQNKINVANITLTIPEDGRTEKAALLECPTVQGLCNVYCDMDPDWALALLLRHSATLQELRLVNVGPGHLEAVQLMPRLRRLEVVDCQADMVDMEAQLRPASAPTPGGGLHWLSVEGLPRAALHALLSAHRRSLRDLQLLVGTSPCAGALEDWPASCSALYSLLRDSGLHGLHSLTLVRYTGCTHSAVLCAAQLAAVRSVMPACVVKCSWCRAPPCSVQ